MDGEFEKFIIRKKNWWDHGNYKVFDDDGELAYASKTKLFEFIKKIRVVNADYIEVLHIESANAWQTRFRVKKDEELLLELNRKFPMVDGIIRAESNYHGAIKIKTNIWRTNFTFLSESDEVARLSFKTWSTVEAGLAIKAGCDADTMLAITIIIAYLNQSGKLY